MLYYEKKFKAKGFKFIIGVDEAGRGPLAGPVVAAAVLLKTNTFFNRIDDSKKLTAKLREKAFFEILENSIYGIGIISEKIIDYVNIFQATRLAMEDAIAEVVSKLKPCKKPGIQILIDGNVKPQIVIPFTNIVKGDAKSQSIASASIIAKVTRDRIMGMYHRVYPQYGFLAHKGYPTKKHKSALKEFGDCLIHRKSFHCD